jgi:hypothetical protein
MVATKIVDMLVEQMAHETGYNMYADGSAVALANLLHMVGPVMGDATTYEHLLQTFVDTVRRRSRASVEDLFTAISAYRRTATEPSWSEKVEIFEFTRRQADDVVARITSGELRDSLDPAVPCLAVLCEDIGQLLGNFKLVHDESNTIARNAVHLLTLDNLPDPVRPGHTMRGLPVTGITFSDSKTTPQLQLADWAAGAARQWATRQVTGHSDQFAERLSSLVRPWLAGAIWPDPNTIANPRRLA